MVQEITDKNFKEEVLESTLPVLVDFWAPWCGPCRMVAPVVEEIAEKYSGRLKVGKLNVDNNTLIASQFEIMSIPTLIIFKDGKIVKRIVGAVSSSELKAKIDDCLKQ
jgi:thioredoxin 1